MTKDLMWLVWGVLLLVLLGCAAVAPVQPVQMLPPTCETTTSAALKATFAQRGITPRIELKGQPAEELRAWLDEYTEQPIPPADQALIFTPDGRAMIVWFDNDCMINYGFMQWEPLARHLGIAPGQL